MFSLHPLLKKIGQPRSGAQAFRRFRVTWLRKQAAPEDLIRFWLGHADKSVTDLYCKLREDLALLSNTHNALMWGCNSGRCFTKVSFIFVGFQLNLFQLLRPRQKVAP